MQLSVYRIDNGSMVNLTDWLSESSKTSEIDDFNIFNGFVLRRRYARTGLIVTIISGKYKTYF